jgi:hypothetical protein
MTNDECQITKEPGQNDECQMPKDERSSDNQALIAAGGAQCFMVSLPPDRAENQM